MIVGLSRLICVALLVGAPGLSAAGREPARLQAQQSREIDGLIVDVSGAPVPNATVTAEAGGRELGRTETAADGRFRLSAGPGGPVLLVANASGFAPTSETIDPAAAGGLVRLVLQPATVYDTVTVTGTRGADRLESAGSTTVLTSAEILNAAPASLDDVLRSTPGFSLFRRSSSRTANPTTQGVTLRGLSGSGASRTLVLADGLPLNDPFGSWVYWNRVPIAALDRVEVVRGGQGDLYGADAVGGVIQLLTHGQGRSHIRAIFDGASHGTGRASISAAGRRNHWTASVSGELLETDGVIEIAAADRGPIDVPAGSDYRTAIASVGYMGDGGWRVRGRGAVYGEDRSNGTPYQRNSTDWRQFDLDAAGTAGGGAWVARAAGGTQSYFQTFSAVAGDRASERPTREQTVPTSFSHFSGQWARAVGRHTILVGGEAERSDATLNEFGFTFAGVPLPPTVGGGTETTAAAFGRASLAAGDRTTVMLGGRADHWASDPLQATDPSHAVTFFSPSAALVWQGGQDVTLRASAYRSYRTPTLNELHRGFRVGNVVTSNNPLLQPERLTGFEGSVLFSRPTVATRVTAFWNRLDDLVTNVTLSVTPSLITRQRQNTDTVRAAGLEIETNIRPHRSISLNGLVVLTSSVFDSSPDQPALEGNRIPQVPTYQIGAGVTYLNPALLTASVQVRAIGKQYEDDRNELPLDAFALVELYASREIVHGLHGFAAVENLFDTEYDVGRTPLRLIGWPRTVRAGVRVVWP